MIRPPPGSRVKADRRDQDRQPAAGGQGTPAGRAQRATSPTSTRNQRLPSAVLDRESFRMSKHDIQASPIYKRESIDAHLTTVFAAPDRIPMDRRRTPVAQIKKLVRTTRRHRTIQIQAGAHILTAADPLPDDLREASRASTWSVSVVCPVWTVAALWVPTGGLGPAAIPPAS